MTNTKPTVFLVCSGVGHVNRGYESFTTECFDELKKSENFELFLLKGGGKTQGHELKINCIQRNSKLGKTISKITGRENYWIEQVTFLLSMVPKLLKYKPAVIYYSDFILGTFLWHLRKKLNLKYKLLFSNGAPNGPPFNTEDHIQQLLPLYIEQAHAGGTPLSKMTLLPYAIKIDKEAISKNIQNRFNLLKELNLPTDKKIIICVGAVNSHHKRIDYLVSEFAQMKNDDYFLVVLGQIDELSTPILKQAAEQIPNNNYIIKQVSSKDVMRYLCVSNYFILTSLSEGLPRVLPEALSSGLLPIVHDYTVTQETLKDYGVYRDMKNPGILAGAIAEVDERNISKDDLTRYVFENYSWQHLGAEYEDLVVKMLN